MHHPEYHSGNVGGKLNRLRAAVLGANDGIISVAGLVFGVLGATTDSGILFATGVAGIIAGALSMAVGEYVSVSSSLDSERALLSKERYELEHFPEHEFEELVNLYEKKGLSKETARLVAKELTEHDAFRAHVEAELKIDPEHLTNPWQAAFASAGAFSLGALIPFIAVILPSADFRIPVAFVAIIVALALTGTLSAIAGGADAKKASFRVVIGGIAAMAITYAIGYVIGVSV